MSHKIANPDETKYVVCHNGDDIYHYAVVDSGVLETGQPNIDVFDSEEKAYDKYGEELPDRPPNLDDGDDADALL